VDQRKYKIINNGFKDSSLPAGRQGFKGLSKTKRIMQKIENKMKKIKPSNPGILDPLNP